MLTWHFNKLSLSCRTTPSSYNELFGVSQKKPCSLISMPRPWWYLCKKYPSPLSPAISLLVLLLSVFPNSNQLTSPLEKRFLIVLFSVVAARSTHYTLSCHRTYYSICFLDCSNENYKALHTWHRILTTKTLQHRIGLRHLGIIENTRKLLNTCLRIGLY